MVLCTLVRRSLALALRPNASCKTYMPMPVPDQICRVMKDEMYSGVHLHRVHSLRITCFQAVVDLAMPILRRKSSVEIDWYIPIPNSKLSPIEQSELSCASIMTISLQRPFYQYPYQKTPCNAVYPPNPAPIPLSPPPLPQHSLPDINTPITTHPHPHYNPPTDPTTPPSHRPPSRP